MAQASWNPPVRPVGEPINVDGAIRDYVERAQRFQAEVHRITRDRFPYQVTKHVEEHDAEQLVCPESGWTFTRVKTGCIRVQKGDFTAYLVEREADALAEFIESTRPPLPPPL